MHDQVCRTARAAPDRGRHGSEGRARAPRRGRGGALPGASAGWWCSPGTGDVAHGELDVVATDADRLVVCEVKTRSGTRFGEPAEAVDAAQGRPDPPGHAGLAGRPPGALVRDPVRRASRCSWSRAGPVTRAALRGGVLMGLARAWSVALLGVEGHVVEIEADIGGGLPRRAPGRPARRRAARVEGPGAGGAWSTPGAPGRTSGSCWRSRRPPCARPAAGSTWPWPAACSRRPGRWRSAPLDGTVLLGELALDGRLRPCAACCPACSPRARRACAAWWCRRPRCPRPRWSTGIEVYGAATLGRGAGLARGRPGAGPAGSGRRLVPDAPIHDLADVVGQDDARRALRGRRGRRAPPAAGRAARHRARRCSPSGSSGCCPSSPRTRRWRSPRSGRWPGRLPADGR